MLATRPGTWTTALMVTSAWGPPVTLRGTVKSMTPSSTCSMAVFSVRVTSVVWQYG